jgi:hypothetical protein
MATHLDTQVTAFRERPLDAGPYTFVWVDALTVKVREDANHRATGETCVSFCVLAARVRRHDPQGGQGLGHCGAEPSLARSGAPGNAALGGWRLDNPQH